MKSVSSTVWYLTRNMLWYKMNHSLWYEAYPLLQKPTEHIWVLMRHMIRNQAQEQCLNNGKRIYRT